MSIIKSNAVAPPPSGGLSSISEMNSLRFDGTSSYLSRTPTTAGNRKTWTWSGWLKRGNVGVNQTLFAVETVNGNTYTDIKFVSNNKIYLDSYGSASELRARMYSNAVYRDISAWYHIVGVLDTSNATASDRAIIYVNGARKDATISDGFSLNANLLINTINEHRIGTHPLGNEGYFNGYLANIHFIDGQALDHNSFGETVSDIWVPKQYSGTYGTNGFHLDFADANNIGNDVSGRGNHWTVN